MDYREYIGNKIKIDGVDHETISGSIEIPPTNDMGDYALPCFKFSKVLRKSPIAIAEELKSSFITDDIISEVNDINGYLNFKVNRLGYAKSLLREIEKEGENFALNNLFNLPSHHFIIKLMCKGISSY